MIGWGSWLLLLSVLQWAFIGCIHSILATPTRANPIDTMEDLIRSLEHEGRWLSAYDVDPFYRSVLNSNDETSKRLKNACKITKNTTCYSDLKRRANEPLHSLCSGSLTPSKTVVRSDHLIMTLRKDATAVFSFFETQLIPESEPTAA